MHRRCRLGMCVPPPPSHLGKFSCLWRAWNSSESASLVGKHNTRAANRDDGPRPHRHTKKNNKHSTCLPFSGRSYLALFVKSPLSPRAIQGPGFFQSIVKRRNLDENIGRVNRKREERPRPCLPACHMTDGLPTLRASLKSPSALRHFAKGRQAGSQASISDKRTSLPCSLVSPLSCNDAVVLLRSDLE